MHLRSPLLPFSVVLAMLMLAPSAANASATPQVAVEPPSATIGETAVVTATGLGGLETATFGLDDVNGGAFVGDGVEVGSTTARVPVEDGTASIGFTPTRSGDVVIAVGTGESALAQTTLTVAAASAEPLPATADPSVPSPSASAGTVDDSAQAQPDPEVETGRFAFVLIPLLAAVVIGAGVVIAIARSRRRRRGD